VFSAPAWDPVCLGVWVAELNAAHRQKVFHTTRSPTQYNHKQLHKPISRSMGVKTTNLFCVKDGYMHSVTAMLSHLSLLLMGCVPHLFLVCCRGEYYAANNQEDDTAVSHSVFAGVGLLRRC